VPIFSAYVVWLRRRSPADRDRAILAALPLIAPALTDLRCAFVLDRGDTVGEGTLAITEYIHRRRYRGSLPREYVAALQQDVVRAVRLLARRMTIPRDADALYERPVSYSVERRVGMSLFLQRLPRRLYVHAIERNRLDGMEHRASRAITIAILRGHRIVPTLFCTHYGLDRARLKFIVDYSMVRVRLALVALTKAEGGVIVNDWRDEYELMSVYQHPALYG